MSSPPGTRPVWHQRIIWVKKDTEQVLKAHLILAKVKREVDYDNPLYSTGILIDREALRKARELLGSRYELETDSDLFNLVKERGRRSCRGVKGGSWPWLRPQPS